MNIISLAIGKISSLLNFASKIAYSGFLSKANLYILHSFLVARMIP